MWQQAFFDSKQLDSVTPFGPSQAEDTGGARLVVFALINDHEQRHGRGKQG